MKKPHKHAELIKAWADGAEIEYYLPISNNWLDAGDNPRWFKNVKYRVKLQPKLVPFDLPKDAEKLIGKVVRYKESGSLYLVTGVYEDTIMIGIGECKPENALKSFTFSNGEPFGKYVEYKP